MVDWPTASAWSGTADDFAPSFPSNDAAFPAHDLGAFEFPDPAKQSALPDVANHGWAPFPASSDPGWPSVADSWPPADPSISEVTPFGNKPAAGQMGTDSWPAPADPQTTESVWGPPQTGSELWPQSDASPTPAAPITPVAPAVPVAQASPVPAATLAAPAASAPPAAPTALAATVACSASAAPSAPATSNDTLCVSNPQGPSDAAAAPVDETVDEVTHHLLCARSKIEAVELEFAHIMEELAAYGQRLPASAKTAGSFTDAAASPFNSTTSQQMKPEYFLINTPSAAQRADDSASFTWSSLGEGRRLMESLGEGSSTALA